MSITFDDLIKEDTASGGGGVLRPHPITLLDLAGIASKIQQTDGTAPKTLPYPGQFLLEEIADVYIAAGKVHARLLELEKNALVANSVTAKKKIQRVICSLYSIKKLCKIMGTQLDSLSIDKQKVGS
jgi:hypothetical protein